MNRYYWTKSIHFIRVGFTTLIISLILTMSMIIGGCSSDNSETTKSEKETSYKTETVLKTQAPSYKNTFVGRWNAEAVLYSDSGDFDYLPDGFLSINVKKDGTFSSSTDSKTISGTWEEEYLKGEKTCILEVAGVTIGGMWLQDDMMILAYTMGEANNMAFVMEPE